QDDDAAQPRRPGPLCERQRGTSVVRHERRCAVAQCRRDSTLAAGLNVEQRQREPLALLRERPSGGRQPFPLGQRTLQRLQPLARDARLLEQRLAFGADARIEHAPWTGELDAERVELRLGGLAAELEPLAR